MGVYSRGKIYDCLKCKKRCLLKKTFITLRNIPDCILKNKTLNIDSFQKISSLLDLIDRMIPNRPLIQLLETHLGLCGQLYINEMTNEIFDRYFFEKKYNCSSFGTNFDRVPSWWKWIVKVIDFEIDLIHKTEDKESNGRKHSHKSVN